MGGEFGLNRLKPVQWEEEATWRLTSTGEGGVARRPHSEKLRRRLAQ